MIAGGPEVPDETNSEFLRAPLAQGPRRTMILCGLGALLGLAVAGYSLFTAKGTRTGAVPAEDVALVNGVPILMSDFQEQLRAAYAVSSSEATPAQREEVLSGMIREELLVQRGLELGLQTDVIEVRSALVAAVEAQATIDANVALPDESALRALYQQEPARYADAGTMTLHDYIAPQRPSKQAMIALRAGHGTPQVAALLGLVSSGKVDDGEEFYFAAQLHLGPALFEKAKLLQPGQLSEPIDVDGKWHVLVMIQHKAPAPAPFDMVVDRVRSDYVTAAAKRQGERTEKFLRERADVKLQSGFK